MSNQSYFGDENDYGDDDGLGMGFRSHDGGDEQQLQKVSSRMSLLQDEVRNLQQELIDERRAHSQTKKFYEAKLNEAKEEAMVVQNERYVSKEQKKLRQELEDTRKQLRLAEFGPSMVIRNEILKICNKNKVMVECDDADQMDDAMTMRVLKQIHKYFKAARKAPAEGLALTGGESDNELAQRVKILESELRMALLAAEDIKALKSKLMQLVDRIRTEKEHKLKVESDMSKIQKRIDMLTDHIEKLMIHLKHEAAAKVRATDQLRVAEKEILALKDKCENIFRKSNSKDRLIVELREGSKVLEDQLRLMDDKYIELRGKLDHARENGLRRVKVAEKAASELRMKWALSGGGGSLDSLPLPDIFTGMSWDNDTQDFMPTDSPHSSIGAHSNKTPKKSPKSKTSGSSTKSGSSDILPKQEPTIELINEKLRIQSKQKINWSEEQIRDLVNSH